MHTDVYQIGFPYSARFPYSVYRILYLKNILMEIKECNEMTSILVAK